MSLVKPLVPSHMSSLINAGRSSDTTCGSSHSLEQLLEDLVYEERCDRREQARLCREALEAHLQDSSEVSEVVRMNLQHRLFAAHLIESLWHLRIHDAKAARACLCNARSLVRSKACSIPQVVILESLGLVTALVAELEDRLARIEPCL